MPDTRAADGRKQQPLVIERTYRATFEEIWDLWTTKEGFESWWGPQGFRVDLHELDAREGGKLRYDMVADTPEAIAAMEKVGQPRMHSVHSRFSVLEPRTHLVLTNVIDFVPGVEPYESTVAVDLVAEGDRVRMVLTLSPMHSVHFSGKQKEGFTSQLSKLDARFGVG